MNCYLAPVLAYRGEFEASIPAALRCAYSSGIAREWGLTDWSDEKRAIEGVALDVETVRELQRHVAFVDIVWPALVGVLAPAMPKDEARSRLAHLHESIMREAATIGDPDYWLTLAESASMAFKEGANRSDLEHRLELVVEDSYQRVLLLLGLSLVGEVQLARSASVHGVVFVYIEQMALTTGTAGAAFRRWLIDYWRSQVARRSFAFALPGLLRDELDLVGARGVLPADVARVLLAAEVATGARFAADVRGDLVRIRDAG